MFGLKPAGIWPSLTEKKLIWSSFTFWIFWSNFAVKIGTCVKNTVVLWQGLNGHVPQENETEFFEKTEKQHISIIWSQKPVQKSKSTGDPLCEKTPRENQSPVAHKECGILSEEENGLVQNTFFCEKTYFSFNSLKLIFLNHQLAQNNLAK